MLLDFFNETLPWRKKDYDMREVKILKELALSRKCIWTHRTADIS